MKRLITILLWVFFCVWLGSNSTVFGQCYVQVVKSCTDEQFDNSCEEPCAMVGASCGSAVGSFPIDYADVGPATRGENGQDGFTDVPNGLLQCGDVLQCVCFRRSKTGEFYCGLDRFPVVSSTYEVHQKMPFGDPCEGDGDPDVVPIVIASAVP
jgi:hypothetical protein